jgi:hypothetical protein
VPPPEERARQREARASPVKDRSQTYPGEACFDEKNARHP